MSLLLCDCYYVIVLRHCYCVIVTISLLLCYCYGVIVTMSLLLCHCYYIIVTMSLLRCHCYYVTVTVSLLLYHCYYVTVTVSLLLCHCYCVIVTISLLICDPPCENRPCSHLVVEKQAFKVFKVKLPAFARTRPLLFSRTLLSNLFNKIKLTFEVVPCLILGLSDDFFEGVHQF